MARQGRAFIPRGRVISAALVLRGVVYKTHAGGVFVEISMNVDFYAASACPSNMHKRPRDEGGAVEPKRIKDDQAVLRIRRALCAYAAQRRARMAEIRAAEQRRIDAEVCDLLVQISTWKLGNRILKSVN